MTLQRRIPGRASSLDDSASELRPGTEDSTLRSSYVLDELFACVDGANRTPIVAADRFHRARFGLRDGSEVLLDTFPDFEGAACCFVRLPEGRERVVRLVIRSVNEVVDCVAGGWLFKHGEASSISYWVPQPPAVRTVDSHGRILSEQAAALGGFGGTADELWVEFRLPQDSHLDLTLWRFPATLRADSALQEPLTVERQRWFMRSSHAVFRGPSDLYRCLIHGHVYDNRFVWRRIWGGFRWRICSENEALSLYVVLSGLERATQRPLYTLLKRQVLFSIIARQAPDGGWHHGEWTDLMESHFRLHNAGVLLLEAALEEAPDPVVAKALEAAATFTAGRTDDTAVGLWFLHDSLEESVAMATAKDAPPWTPTSILGASVTNKFILNTHLDALVALDRYREITGDPRHSAAVDAGRSTARAVLALRPAEWLYRMVFAAVRLTLLPHDRANRLSLPLRAVRRFARDYLTPQLFRLKRIFPRFVMPGGLLDRHLSPKHFDMGYHPVNLLDVARVSRRFPEDGFSPIMANAVEAVARTGLLQFWAESKHMQPIGYWVEALYHLCTLDTSPAYRAHLAEAMLCAEDAGLGLSPSLLGADAEAVKFTSQVACPSPRDARLRVANLSSAGKLEFLVVNTATVPIDLTWQDDQHAALSWVSDGRPVHQGAKPISVPPRGWLLGRGR